MPPTDRFVVSFAAEPPQETLPYGRWANTLAEHFLKACREIDSEGEELGEPAYAADMTLVWGVPLIPGGALVTAELANLAVDQCQLLDERFTLIAADNYRHDFLEIKLW